jgi:UDP-4-amino-4-deoxy-L-arabinose formyltransferase/UDP-glucuronic acid dehydrogenase (UDP-4-keto-hexauronic acid decarboxylating)
VRPLRVVVAAEEAAGVQVIRKLLELPRPPELVAVLTTPSPRSARRPLVYEAAEELGLRTWPAELVRQAELGNALRDEEVDLLVNVHSLHVVHPAVLQAPRIGSFNLHPGPLPQYAGLNAPSWAIFHGERKHAATVHWMGAGIDTGPIAYTAGFEIGEGDTGLAVAGKCVRVGVPLLVRLVEQAAVEPAGIPRLEQEPSLRRYFGAGAPNGGRIDWRASASEVVRFVRAADYAPFDSPWGHPRAELFGRDVGIAKASTTATLAGGAPGAVVEVDDRGALVAARDELVLVERLWLDGRYQRVADVVGNLPSGRLRS